MDKGWVPKAKKCNLSGMFNMDLLPYLLYDFPQISPSKEDTNQAIYSKSERYYNH
jgi:hypothetical protein